MPLRIGILSGAHMHAWSYLHSFSSNPRSSLAGIWDADSERSKSIHSQFGCATFDKPEALISECDAVVITSENSHHAELAMLAASAGKHILCEKPLVISEAQASQMLGAVERAGVKLMTAFPCRFAPSYLRLRERVQKGETGKIKAICGTNQGRCPFGWFVEKDKAGGGAMIDHVVHVADLMRDLIGEDPISVYAQTGNNMYGKDWEDTAMLSLDFPDNVFATIDSSWSRPASYKTWGGVTMNVVGESGVIELNIFNQNLDLFSNSSGAHSQANYGSNADAAMIEEFLDAIEEDRAPKVTGWDGLMAARVALAGYESAKTGQPAPVSSQAPQFSPVTANA
jgi:predicted dehydrogenase